MSPAIILFLLRLIAAVLLLSFLGVIAWLIYRDIKLLTIASEKSEAAFGRLLVLDSPQERLHSQSFALYAETWVGRSSDNAVVVDDAYTSNQHAVLRRKAGQWWLEDLGSRNGTLLNDMLLTEPTVVTSGDHFTVGRTTLEIELGVSEKGGVRYTIESDPQPESSISS